MSIIERFVKTIRAFMRKFTPSSGQQEVDMTLEAGPLSSVEKQVMELLHQLDRVQHVEEHCSTPVCAIASSAANRKRYQRINGSLDGLGNEVLTYLANVPFKDWRRDGMTYRFTGPYGLKWSVEEGLGWPYCQVIFSEHGKCYVWSTLWLAPQVGRVTISQLRGALVSNVH